MPEIIPTDTFGFDPEVQAKVVALLFIDPYSLGDCLKTMRPEFFDNPIDQRIAGIILGYLADYERPITVEILEAEFKKLLAEPRLPSEEYSRRFAHILGQVSEEGLAYARDTAKDWLISQAAKMTIPGRGRCGKGQGLQQAQPTPRQILTIGFHSISRGGTRST